MTVEAHLHEQAQRALSAIHALHAERTRYAPLLKQTKRLRDGSLGYYARLPRTDDCWAAAFATCLGVAIGEVPDPRLDERLQAGEDPERINGSAWEVTRRWLAQRSLRMVVHRKVPVARRRWIGVAPHPGVFADHCVVMSFSEPLFDPVEHPLLDGLTCPVGDIQRGFSFQSTIKNDRRK